MTLMIGEKNSDIGSQVEEKMPSVVAQVEKIQARENKGQELLSEEKKMSEVGDQRKEKNAWKRG